MVLPRMDVLVRLTSLILAVPILMFLSCSADEVLSGENAAGEQAEEVTRRRQKFFQSSAGYLSGDAE